MEQVERLDVVQVEEGIPGVIVLAQTPHPVRRGHASNTSFCERMASMRTFFGLSSSSSSSNNGCTCASGTKPKVCMVWAVGIHGMVSEDEEEIG